MNALTKVDPAIRLIIENLIDDNANQESVAKIRLEMDAALAHPKPYTEWLKIEHLIRMGVKCDALCMAMKDGRMAQVLELVGFTPEELEIIGSELPVILMPGNPSTVGIWVNREYALVEPLIDEHVIDEPPIEGPPIGGPPTDIQE